MEDRARIVHRDITGHIRPHLGVNVKVDRNEELWHAARRAVVEKLDIKRPVGIEFITKELELIHETQFPGLKSQHCMFAFRYEIPADLYKPEGYTFKKANGNKVLFKWIPVSINAECKIAP